MILIAVPEILSWPIVLIVRVVCVTPSPQNGNWFVIATAQLSRKEIMKCEPNVTFWRSFKTDRQLYPKENNILFVFPKRSWFVAGLRALGLWQNDDFFEDLSLQTIFIRVETSGPHLGWSVLTGIWHFFGEYQNKLIRLILSQVRPESFLYNEIFSSCFFHPIFSYSAR